MVSSLVVIFAVVELLILPFLAQAFLVHEPLVAVYVVCLSGFIIWVGLLVSFIFFAGAKPPLAAG